MVMVLRLLCRGCTTPVLAKNLLSTISVVLDCHPSSLEPTLSAVLETCSASHWFTAGDLCVLIQATERHGFPRHFLWKVDSESQPPGALLQRDVRRWSQTRIGLLAIELFCQLHPPSSGKRGLNFGPREWWFLYAPDTGTLKILSIW